MPRFGSDANSLSQSIVGINDESGNQLVDTSVDFSASPLGAAARAQALFGIANAQFNLLPPEPASELANFSNPLPYWSVDNLSDGRLTATSTFDTATSTWGVVLNPTAGSASDSITLKTRSYLLNDDNLSLRQKAFLTLAKSGTAAGTTQFNVVMTAEYFDANDASLSGGTAYAIGTALDTATFTTINGFTTAGSAAIGASAAYADIKVTLTCSANVTGSAKATLKSLLLQSSTPTTGSLLIVERFTSSTTWTVPTGVTTLAGAWAIGGGGGGGGGGLYSNDDPDSASGATAGGGGGAGAWVYGQNLYVGDLSTISIGIGAAGAAGTATAGTVIGTNSVSSGKIAGTGGNGGAGGDTTFGSILLAKGATGGQGGGAGTSYTTSIGGTPGTPQTGSYVYAYGGTVVEVDASQTGGTGFIATASNKATAYFLTPTLLAPFNPTYAIGGASQSSTASSWTATIGTVTTSSIRGASTSAGTGLIQGGAGGGGGRAQGTALAIAATTAAGGTARFSGAGGGGAAIVWNATSAGTVSGTLTGGNAGSAATNSGAGGAGGGGVAYHKANFTRTNHRGTVVMTSGSGGAGADGLVVVTYVG